MASFESTKTVVVGTGVVSTPRLEHARRSLGRYPSELRLWEAPPANAPWLIRRFNYASDGRTYTLAVMDPGLCGRVMSYSSSTRQWTETDDPCWY